MPNFYTKLEEALSRLNEDEYDGLGDDDKFEDGQDNIITTVDLTEPGVSLEVWWRNNRVTLALAPHDNFEHLWRGDRDWSRYMTEVYRWVFGTKEPSVPILYNMERDVLAAIVTMSTGGDTLQHLHDRANPIRSVSNRRDLV